MRKINLTPALTSLAAAKKLHATAKNDKQAQRENKATVIAAYAIDALAGKVRKISMEDYQQATGYGTVEAMMRKMSRSEDVTLKQLMDIRSELTAACLVGYVIGTAADELNASSVYRLNKEDYQSIIGECFDPENFDFDLWCSQHPINPDAEEPGFKP